MADKREPGKAWSAKRAATLREAVAEAAADPSGEAAHALPRIAAWVACDSEWTPKKIAERDAMERGMSPKPTGKGRGGKRKSGEGR